MSTKKTTFDSIVLDYYRTLEAPTGLPADVEVMNPYRSEETFQLAAQFYQRFYEDHDTRFICFGINPGRFGAGVTGVPFTDPFRLSEVCGIAHHFEHKAELSSKFIYEMIDAYGGVDAFYRKYFISAVSPLGYVKNGINLNYYDIKGFKSLFESYVAEQIRTQLDFGLIDQSKAFSIGMGQNIKYLNYINDRHHFFKEIIPLPHPRWVMQYRLKKKKEYIQVYLDQFKS